LAYLVVEIAAGWLTWLFASTIVLLPVWAAAWAGAERRLVTLAFVLFAIVMLQVLSSGLNMFPTISNFYRPLIWGAVLLFVICMNEGAFSVRRLIDASRRLLKKGTQQ